MDNKLLIEEIKNIVREASKIMLNEVFTIDEKSGHSDLVTSNDIAVQKFLEEKLTLLINNSAFFGEEGKKIPSDAEYVWVVDPIDGTANYSRGLGLSVISVALLKNGKRFMGVVYNPYKEEMFHAVLGEGAYLNNEVIHVSDRPLEKSMLCSAMCLYEKRYAKPCFNIIERIYERSDDLRRLGTAALELCYVACGRAELYFEIRLSPWDYGAGTLIINEAGGFSEVMFNDDITLEKPAGVIAANSKENFEFIKNVVYDEIKEEPVFGVQL